MDKLLKTAERLRECVTPPLARSTAGVVDDDDRH
jgi:hypothetical protein